MRHLPHRPKRAQEAPLGLERFEGLGVLTLAAQVARERARAGTPSKRQKETGVCTNVN